MPLENRLPAIPAAPQQFSRPQPRTIVRLLMLSMAFFLTVVSAARLRAAAPTYLLSEGFEGPGYENSGWTVPAISTTAPDPDHTSTVLLGSQSLRCNGVSFIQRPFERENPFYCYLRVRWAAWSDYKFVVDWLDDAQSSTATLMTSFGNKLEIKHGSVSVPGTTTIALNTTYHVWLEWTRGSGSDGTMKLFVSLDGTKPAVPEVFITTGNGVETALFDVGPFGTGVDVVYDSILIDDEPIGSNPGGNTPPTISGIANQSTPENTPTAPLAFTIGDMETNALNLIVTGSSSNQDLVADANMVFGGFESNRTVTLTPSANQSGIATITLTVSDGAASSSTSFAITVGTFNSPPTISPIPNQSTPINTPTSAIAFTIDDAQVGAGSLVVEGTSSNTNLVPDSNIVFGGAGTNRTVTITPAAGETGTSIITIRVDDGQLTNTTSFTVTVSTPNTPPTLSALSGQSILQDTVLGPINFNIADAETAASALSLTGASSNPDLIPNANIFFGGDDGSRTVTITPLAGQTGTSTITIMVDDGELTVSRSFLVTVSPNGTGTPGGLLFEEGFEGAGYENTGWSELGLPDPNHTNQVLRGSQSLNLTGSEFIYRTFVATNHFNLYLRARWNAWVDYISFIYFETEDYRAAGSLFADNNLLQINHGSVGANGTTPIELDTTYHIWLEWIRGEGANGTLNLYVSTNVIKPSLPEATIATGNGDSIERIYFGSFSAGFDVVIDSLFIDDETIGSNPLGNQAPFISSIADQTINEDTATGPVAFTVGDQESPAAALILSTFSSDTNLVPAANIVFGGSESNRTVTVTPAANQTGTATITVQVRDNALTSDTTFQVTVNPVNDAPEITLPGGPADFVKGTAPVAINTNATFADIDSPSLGGGQLSISISGNGAEEDRLAIRSQGAGPGEIEVSGIGVSYEGVGIGTFDGGTNGSTPLVIAFNASATPQAAQALLRNITFTTLSETPSLLPRAILVAAADGQGGTSTPSTSIVNVLIVAANPTVSWPVPEPILYGTALTELQLNAVASVPGTFTYSPTTTAILGAGVDQPLTAIFTPADSVNYNSVTTSVPITVTPAPLLVTANATNRAYGTVNPAFTAAITGFVNGDDEADLDAPVTFSTTADATSPVGSYDILSAGATDLNYSITFANGSLTVTPAPLLVTANNTNRAYGETNPIFTATFTGFLNGDDEADLLGTLAFTTPAETNSAVGPYPITPSGLTATNYTIVFADGTLTVTAFALVVTADNQFKLYGAGLPALTGTIVGVHNGDDITATFSTAATAASDAGLYPITPALNDPNNLLTNYSVTLVSGTLTNLPAPLLVTANATNRAYGTVNPAFTAAITGFVNGDDEADLDAPVTFSTAADATSPVGSCDILPAGATDLNYSITFANGSLAVTPPGPLMLALVTADATGNVTLRVTSDPGQRVKIQASIELSIWEDIVTLNNPTGTIDHTDPGVPDRPKRFYRAILAPGAPE